MLNSEKHLLSFSKDNFAYKNLLHLFVCVTHMYVHTVHTPSHGYTKMPWYMCGGQENQFSPSTMSV